ELLPRWFTRFRGFAISQGGLSPLGLAAPGRYAATYDLRSRKNKRISVRYRHQEGPTVAGRGPEHSSEIFPVDAAQRAGADDQLAARRRMREVVRKGVVRGGGFIMPVFDGKRRFDVEERSLTEEIREIAGAERRVLHLDLMLHPIAGFKDNDP